MGACDTCPALPVTWHDTENHMNSPPVNLENHGRNLLYIVDWLPPDFGAVGQYALKWCRTRAAQGDDVVLLGLTTGPDSITEHVAAAGQPPIKGRLRVVKIHCDAGDKAGLARRSLWTLRTNLRLVGAAWPWLGWAQDIRFTGSPPFLVHLLAPLNRAFGKRLIYRIADFHPECLMAALGRTPWPLELFYRLTLAWRRTVSRFEVLGEDQRQRLLDIGIEAERIVLDRDSSPVSITPQTQPLALPPELGGHAVLLYSGNFGIAHDYETFLGGYRLHHREGVGKVKLWLCAKGVHADKLAASLEAENLPFYRSGPVPVEQLASLLVTPHAHLITLRDGFWGYVMPSKSYGCAQSGKDVLFIGDERSDAHLICSQRPKGGRYWRVGTGDSKGVASVLDILCARAGLEVWQST